MGRRVVPEGRPLRSPAGTRRSAKALIGAEPEGRAQKKPAYFCPTFASRAANWSRLPSRGAAKKAQAEPSFRPTGADSNRPQRSLGDDP